MARKNSEEYQEVSVIKRKTFFGIGAILSVLGLTLLFSLLLSPLFGLNYINFIFGKGEGTQTSTFYAIMVDTNSTDSEYATEQAQKYRVRGGAGVIFKKDTYHIILSAYPNQKDAEKVSDQLTTDSLKPEIMKIEVKSENLSSFLDADRELYQKCFNFTLSTLNSLYDITYNLDTNEVTEINANLQIKNIQLEASYYNQQLFDNQKKQLEDILMIVSSANSLLQYVSNEEELTSTVLPYASDVRRVFVRLLLLIYEV